MKFNKNVAVCLAMLLSLQTSLAAVVETNITGVTGQNGVYNIDPTSIKDGSGIGFRNYENFDLKNGDIANLIFKYGDKNISTFVNMVNNGIKIDGIVNSMRDGNFYNGHAVFVSPNGMVVGASGVLNVGSLSVATPTEEKYNRLVKHPSTFNLGSLQQDANADIKIDGKVLTRGSVDLTGSNVEIGKTAFIHNGITSDIAVTKQEHIQDLLFNSLVNYGDAVSSEKALAVENGKVIIRSTAEDGSIKLAGQVINTNNGDVRLLNSKGSGGITVAKNGSVENYNGGQLALINRNGATSIKGNVTSKDGNATIMDSANGITIASTGNVNTKNGNLGIVNDGANGLVINGAVSVNGENALIKNNKGDLSLAGNINLDTSKAKQIINTQEGGSLVFAEGSKLVADGKAPLYIKNYSDSGISLLGNIENKGQGATIVDNRAGDFMLDGTLVSNNVSLVNSGKVLSVADNGKVQANGKLVIKNVGTGDTNLLGTIENTDGVTSIIDSNAKLNLAGTVKTNGDTALKARGTGLEFADTSKIEVTNGNLVIQNRGKDGMSLAGNVSTDGDAYIVNNHGAGLLNGNISAENVNIKNINEDKTAFTIGSTIKGTNVTIYSKSGKGMTVKGKVNADESAVVFNEAGNLKVAGKINSLGDVSIQNKGNGALNITKSAKVDANGNLVVLNNGTKGMKVNGTLTNDGNAISVTNKKGDASIAGTIHSKNGNIGIVNKADGGSLTITDDALIINDDGITNIINVCEDGMSIGGNIKSAGDLNITNDNGLATISAEMEAPHINTFSRYNSQGIVFVNDEEPDVLVDETLDIDSELDNLDDLANLDTDLGIDE